jgi:ammonia channel protein AmtB
VGDWAALVGALILGPRRGKHGAGCRINPMPGANLPLATLGTFILWFGWFGFNGGSQLAMGSAAVGAFVSATAAITWLILKATIGIRASEEDKASGLDQAGLGLEAYPEFRRGSQTV